MKENMDLFIAKYKPYYLNEFCMAEETQAILRTLFEIDDLNLLFVGGPGSGKTTLLYCILREYYGLGKTAVIPETNVLFINNLKEQGIQYYRNDMKTFCQSHCSIYGKKKMVVVDDLDTVNEQSQQVFRNYMDKYKHNVHFISVCTNIQKVIESIQSRVHMIHLASPSETDILPIMDHILEQEGIQVDAEAREYIWKNAQGSLRVLINSLEKLFIYGGTVDGPLCRQLCSTISSHKFENYINCLEQGKLTEAISELYAIYDQGYSVIDILDYFFAFLKTSSLSEEIQYRIIPILCRYITIFNKVHEDAIELAFFTNYLYNHVFQTITITRKDVKNDII
jgi:DNA polymerase III delta prime subunit